LSRKELEKNKQYGGLQNTLFAGRSDILPAAHDSWVQVDGYIQIIEVSIIDDRAKPFKLA
jgi:hypothetical protein